MPAGGYKIRDQSSIHFITFAVVNWIDVFTRPVYQDLFLESVRHCQVNKGLQLHCWCLMTNHVHFLASAKNKDLSNVLRDFKKYTSHRIIQEIEGNTHESRREWMLPLFKQAAAGNPRNSDNQFWRQDNHPIECYSRDFTTQKMNYIHNNPVNAGYVVSPEEYRLSSAKDYATLKQSGLLDIAFI